MVLNKWEDIFGNVQAGYSPNNDEALVGDDIMSSIVFAKVLKLLTDNQIAMSLTGQVMLRRFHGRFF